MRACPYYLSIGMPYDLFWHGEPWAVRLYRESDRLSMRRADYMAWLQGRYVYDAMCQVAPAYRTFSKRPKPRPYTEKPYSELLDDREREKTHEQQLQNGRIVAERIARMVNRWKEAHGKPNEGEVNNG